MAISDEYLAFVLDQLSMWGDVTGRKMFGGAGIYREGVMFALIADDVLYFKVDASTRAEYEEAGSGPFRPSGMKKSMTMPYYEVPIDILETPGDLAEWASRAYAVAQRSVRRKKPATKK